MKKFLVILSFFLIVPIIICVILYLFACFLAFNILKTGDIEWVFIRFYVIMSIILSIFLSLNKDFK